MLSRRVLWSVGLILTSVLGWYVFEGAWDRRLFGADGGGACRNLSSSEARAWLDAHPDTQVLDVRSEREFMRGAMPSAVNISFGDGAFAERLGALDREKPVLVYCAGGYRSRKAVEVLKRLDFRNIQHLHRGFMSWKG